MSRSNHGVLSLVALLLVGGLGGLFAYVQLGGDDRRVDPITVDVGEAAGPEETLSRPRYVLEPPVRVAIDGSDYDQPSSVLWPVKIDLVLRRADYLPTEEGVHPIYSGRDARLSGHIADGNDRPVRGEVRFAAGPNEGRILHCDATGAFGASDLYPGLDIVEITGPGIVGARREVRMRRNAETLLNIGFGRPGAVHGRVIDQKGGPVQGARVDFDGQIQLTGSDGGFFFAAVAGGLALVEIDHPDYASHIGLHPVASGRELPPGKLTFTLRTPTAMSLSTPAPVGGPGPTLVYVLPASTSAPGKRTAQFGMGRSTHRFPWHRINPIEVFASTPTVVEGLPPEVVKVRAFRAGAVAREQVVNLRTGRVNPVQIRLVPAPKVSGRVTFEGRPAPGVRVTLEAPDRVRAHLGHLGVPAHFLETEVMPYLPPAKQEAYTSNEGRFLFSAWEEVAGVRYLEARGSNGEWAGKLVHRGEDVVDLELEPIDLGDSELVIQFPGRHQGLPVEILVDGEPQDPRLLPPSSDLGIEDLRSGEWSLRVTWNGQVLFEQRRFPLQGREERRIELPGGAVHGQDEVQWRRAGRVWPF